MEPCQTTVLIANYNGEAFLERAVASALAQTVPRAAYEILVVDDGSTDGSLALLERYQAEIRQLRLTHRGLPSACNDGIRAAQGRYLMRLDADDELEPTALAETAAILSHHPDVSVVTTDRWDVDEAMGRAIRVHVDPANRYDLIAPGALFRTQALLEAGLYDELYWEEYDLILRLLQRGQAHHFAVPLYRYHRHPMSMTASGEGRRSGWEALIQKWGMEELRRLGRCPELEDVWNSRQASTHEGKRIAVAAHDAGGCHAILPVLNALKASGVSLRIWADGPAYSILTTNGLAPRPLTVERARADLRRELDVWCPQVVFTGNSHGLSLEDLFVAEARRRGIPSIGVLDAWLLYDQKFAEGGDRWAYLPDTLVVMDDLAKQEMAALGAPSVRLLPLGQPHLDALATRSAALTETDKQAVRASLGAAPGERLVLFLSQDMERFYGGREQALMVLGYTEHLALKYVQESLRRVAQRRHEVIRLAVKLHPREASEKYRSSGLVVMQEADPYPLILSADVVVGMDTILLLEAGLLGCPTLSFQPYRRGTDALVTNRLGLGPRCYDPNDLDGTLEGLLYDVAQREAAVREMRRFTIQPGATRSVTEFVLSHLKKEQGRCVATASALSA